MNCLKINDEDICLVDSGSTHTVLKKKGYFSHLTPQKANISTISGVVNIIDGFGKAHVLLPGGTNLKIENALYSPKSQRNLLNFKDIRKNGYHIETMDEGESEYLLITNISSGKKNVLEKLSMYSFGLYYTKISAIKTNMVINQKFIDRENFTLWHDRLGHPGSVMMRKIIEQSCGHPLENQKILQTKDMTCVACSKGKLITRPSPAKVGFETLNFLERIQGIYVGPYIPLVDHLDYPIKAIRLDNAGEFTSQIFNDYCMSIGIKVEHPVAHANDYEIKTTSSAWGHAILHAATLIRIRPTSYNASSPLKTVFGQEPNISHLRIFGCAVGYESTSIIKYLEPLTGDLFTARFADCHFDESEFPALGGGTKQLDNQKCELEVQKIIHLQGLANQLPDIFTDTKRVTKSHVPAANAPIKIDVPEGQNDMSNESRARLKRGRPLGSKDKNPRKKKGANNQNGHIEVNETPSESPEETLDMLVPEEPQVPENEKISINYNMSRKVWNRDKTDVDDTFAYNVALNVMENEEDQEPKSVDECMHRKDWPKWKDAMQTELNSLTKREVFGPVVRTPEGVKPVGYKWVFVRKRNEKNEIVRYKARLVAQGFSQRPRIDYEETYSPVVDATTFRYLISLVIQEGIDMRLMDVVTAYLYGSLDTDIYMKLPEGLKLHESCKVSSREHCSIKLNKSLYGLKQSGRMWYNRLSEYLLKEGYKNDSICPCIFIKRSGPEYVIIAVYVDDLNIIGTSGELPKAVEYLKRGFEMKDLGKTKFCLGLQIEHLKDGILVHQETYIEKVLKRFYMDKSHPLSTPMVVRSLDVEKDPFRPPTDDEDILGPEVPYLSAIGALMFLAGHTRPDISFSLNLLARYSSCPTKRHWNGVNKYSDIFKIRKIWGSLYGFADAGYLSDPHTGRSQTGYVFTMGGIAISWRSTKQTMTATSSNHAEILAIHEASRQCVWLRNVIQHIRGSCGIISDKEPLTVLYEDNAACIAQLKEGYIKGDRIKHILPKFFFTHDLQKSGDISIQQVRSCENLADLFTKSLPNSIFQRLVHGIGMRRLKDLKVEDMKDFLWCGMKNTRFEEDTKDFLNGCNDNRNEIQEIPLVPDEEDES
ncbi:hypothetical protein OSB04_032062 [Centaurea solstitialis]|uniref:Uncharacterized protein n=1 Tax=Centaurea solstitialis TaxID=347529 RepID=A0AA38W6N1_9ASTR|nr:hypothetical protein OSB04_032062 [Centaurea solstitialis]